MTLLAQGESRRYGIRLYVLPCDARASRNFIGVALALEFRRVARTSCVPKRREQRMPAKTGQQQAGQYRKGQSGNPNGRPQGSRHSATI